MHFECPSCDKEDVISLEATLSKGVSTESPVREPKVLSLPPPPPPPEDAPETAAEAEELPVVAEGHDD